MAQGSMFYCSSCKKLRYGLTEKSYLADIGKLPRRGAPPLLDEENYEQAKKIYFDRRTQFESEMTRAVTQKETRAARKLRPTGYWLEDELVSLGLIRRVTSHDQGRTGRRYIKKFLKNLEAEGTAAETPFPEPRPDQSEISLISAQFREAVVNHLNKFFKKTKRKPRSYYGPKQLEKGVKKFYLFCLDESSDEKFLRFVKPCSDLADDLKKIVTGFYLPMDLAAYVAIRLIDEHAHKNIALFTGH